MPFSIWQNNAPGTNYTLLPLPDAEGTSPAPRARVLAVANHVIGGVLLRQRRRQLTDCSGDRFGGLSSVCSSATRSVAPYGVDPVFNPGTTLFDADLSVGDYYNKSELNSFGVPYGFFPFGDEFVVVIDISMNENRATGILTYLKEGFYIDDLTSDVTVDVATYNSNLKIFSTMRITFTFSASGKIQARSPVNELIIGCCT